MGFVCFFTLLILLLMIIHIGIINEGADFQLLTIPGEKEDNGGQLEEPTPIFNPPLSDNPIFSLAAVASQNPPSPSNSSCTNALPPPLPASLCKDPAFTGQLLQTRRKIIHVVLFGFEVSLLKEPCLSRRDWVVGYAEREGDVSIKIGVWCYLRLMLDSIDSFSRWTPWRST